VTDNNTIQDSPDAFVGEVMRYLDGLSSPEQFERIRQQLHESADHRRVFVQMSLQAQAMAEGLAARELVGAGLTDETEEAGEAEASDVMLEVVEQALRARAIHEIEDQANKQLAEDLRKQQVETQQARARAKMAQADATPRVVVIPKAVAYLGSGLIAALLLLMVYLVAAPTPPTLTPGATAGQPDEQRGRDQAPTPRYVAELGKISDDAQWADQSAGWVPGMQLEAGEIHLVRGWIVVYLNDGAEVTLNAPIRFSVLNTNHSELHYGRLSAQVPESAHGFEVLFPGGVVTDLGTAFTLNVANPGTRTPGQHADPQPSHVEVTDGLVTVAPRRAGQRGDAVPLRRDQYASVALDGGGVEAFEHTNIPVALDLPNTGQDRRHLQTDPHWLVRREGDAQAAPALVIAPGGSGHEGYESLNWAWGGPDTSQWLSYFPNAYQDTANQDTYYYSTAFQVPENFDPDTVALDLKIMVDNQVMAIRVNGELIVGRKNLPYPDVDRSAGIQYHTWIEQDLAGCFVTGENTIEIEVLNDNAGTGLRVEIEAVGTQLYTPIQP